MIWQSFALGASIQEINQVTFIDLWFLAHLEILYKEYRELENMKEDFLGLKDLDTNFTLTSII
jgi:hypothetical protein